MASRTPGEGWYARLEREQRWLLDAVPPGITEERTITDDYLIGTRLRLRRIQTNCEAVFKLCQKIRVDDGSPDRVKITNFYISHEECEQLLLLPSSTIVKTRHNFSLNDSIFAIDRFHGRHSGLILAELELGESEPSHETPAFATCEVTHDDSYSGGYLAFASDEEIRRLCRPHSKQD